MTPITQAGPTIDPRVALTFASQGHQPFTWLEITFPVDVEPTSLLADLAAIGWAEEDTAWRFPYPAYDDAHEALKYDEVSIHVCGPRGSGLFGGWDATEKRGHMLAARRVLRGHSFGTVPVWRKTFADML